MKKLAAIVLGVSLIGTALAAPQAKMTPKKQQYAMCLMKNCISIFMKLPYSREDNDKYTYYESCTKYVKDKSSCKKPFADAKMAKMKIVIDGAKKKFFYCQKSCVEKFGLF